MTNDTDFNLIYDSMKTNFWTLFALHCYGLLPVCAIGILLNVSAAVYLCKRTKRHSAIRIYLVTLTTLDALQLLFTAHSALPFLCVFAADALLSFCSLYRRLLALPLRLASATIDTVHMWVIVGLTAHRYWKISRPLHSHVHDTQRKAKCILLLLAVSGVLFRVPMWFEFQLSSSGNVTFFKTTEFRHDKRYNLIYYFILNTLLYNFVPFVTLTVLNCLILRTLHQARTAVRKDSVYRNRELRAAVAICTIVTFFLAFHSLFIYDVVQKCKVLIFGVKRIDAFQVIVADVSTLLAAISSTLNPLIYVALGTGFRICHRTLSEWREGETVPPRIRPRRYSKSDQSHTSGDEHIELIATSCENT